MNAEVIYEEFVQAVDNAIEWFQTHVDASAVGALEKIAEAQAELQRKLREARVV